jgi:hypothetical protein
VKTALAELSSLPEVLAPPFLAPVLGEGS